MLCLPSILYMVLSACTYIHMVECFYTVRLSDCTDSLESQPGVYLTSHTFPVIFRPAIVLINSTGWHSLGTAPSISTAGTTQPSPAFPGPDWAKCQQSGVYSSLQSQYNGVEPSLVQFNTNRKETDIFIQPTTACQARLTYYL